MKYEKESKRRLGNFPLTNFQRPYIEQCWNGHAVDQCTDYA